METENPVEEIWEVMVNTQQWTELNKIFQDATKELQRKVHRVGLNSIDRDNH
jgi:hypothetical protein